MATADAEAVSIRAISQAVGVTAPSIYRHFEDKDTLVLAVCERAYDRFDDFIEAEASLAADPLGDIKARASAYVRFALANPGQYRFLFMSPSTHKHPDFMNAHSFDRDQTHMTGLVQLMEAIDRGIAEGLVRPIASSMDMAVMLWAQVHGIASLRIAQPDMPWPAADDQVAMLFDCLTHGLCTQSAIEQLDRRDRASGSTTG